MNKEKTVLFVSPDREAYKIACEVFDAAQNYRLIGCDDEITATKKLEAMNFQLILCDEAALVLANTNFLTLARAKEPHAPQIIFGKPAAKARISNLVRTNGAFINLETPFISDQLALAAKRALEMVELSRRHSGLSQELKVSFGDSAKYHTKEESVKLPWSQFEKLVYVSPKMEALFATARQAAMTELPILIQGETGTGKELLARAVHYNSARRDSPMHVQNCGGIADETLHSELFGHVEGAFPGAITDRLGLFQAADGGTVFLDEIFEISPSFQLSLLRFLQKGEIKPLGQDKVKKADVRIIAASNQSLAKRVAEGKFRKDLYYSLKGFELNIPPLRQRIEDIPALATYLLERALATNSKRIIGFSRDALEKLTLYDFPGNVRELEMEISRATALANNNSYILPKHFSDVIAKTQRASNEENTLDIEGCALKDIEGRTLKEMIEVIEGRVVLDMLKRVKWNKSKAAEILGLSRVGIANKIKRYNLTHGN